ncbi:MAG: amino acid adenylation domain-containing protein [Bacteroidota bacterium]
MQIVNVSEANVEIDYYNAAMDEKTVVDSYLNRQAAKVFDLLNGPLFRLGLVQLADNKSAIWLSIHHIIADGWSVKLFYKELLDIYQNLENSDYQSQSLAYNFRDFVYDHNVKLQAGEFESERDFWISELSGDLPRTTLPSSKIQGNNNYQGVVYKKEFNDSLSTSLEKLSADNGVSKFMLLISTLTVLFYKYTGEKDVLFGTDVAGRNNKALESHIGYFLNLLCLRNTIDPSEKFTSLLERVKRNTLNCFANQNYSVDLVMRELGLNSQNQSLDLFKVLVIYQNFDESRSEAEEIFSLDTPGSFIDLFFEFVENNGKLGINLRYNTALFTENEIANFVESFENICFALSNDPLIKDINIISDYQKNKILKDFNLPLQPYDSTRVVDLFEETVHSYPDNVALSVEDIKISYRDLNDKVNRLADLLNNDYASHSTVGIHCEPSTDLIIALLAVLKSGKTYLPIDPYYPSDRVDYMVKDSGVKLILSDTNNDLNTTAEVIDIKAVDWIKWSGQNKNLASNPEDCAYLMYTSGSTGKPKGVRISNRSLADYVQTFIEHFEIDENDKVIQQASISFDTSIEEIFPALCSGAELIILKYGAKDVQKLKSTVTDRKATVVSTIPLIINELNQTAASIDSLRILISGGDVLFPNQINNLIDKVDIYNTYGPTESTVCATYHAVDTLETSSFIGKPIQNRKVYILNEDMNLQPQGAIGELFIGGEGLAMGYLGHEDLNQSAFVSDSISGADGLLYKTGDLARWLEDGTIEFLGRSDHQVKIKGHRIELNEVTAHLQSYSLVTDAVIVTGEGSNHQKYLIAYYSSEEKIGSNDLRDFLLDILPEYMVPRYFVYLQKIPVGASGKVDRKSLPIPNDSDFVRSNDYKAPENSLQQELVAVWQKVLGEEKIGIADNFFELGGNSINATKLAYEIRSKLAKEVSIKDIFKYPTVVSLSRELQNGHSDYPLFQKSEAQTNYPLSHAQLRIWLLSQFSHQRNDYYLDWAYSFKGALDLGQFENSVEYILTRHESLRTIFIEDEGQPRQQILDLDECNSMYEYIDLRDCEDALVQAEEVLADERSQEFDFAKGVFKVSLIQIADDSFTFYLKVHHIAADGWSVNMIANDLATFYNKRVNRLNAFQYRDYAIWEKAFLNSQKAADDQQYWINKLEGDIPRLGFKSRLEKTNNQEEKGKTLAFQLDRELLLKLELVCETEKVSLFTFMVSVLKTLFFRYTGQNDIVIGTPVAGREINEVVDIVGCFINTIPLRTQLNPETNFKRVCSMRKPIHYGLPYLV